VISNLQHVKRCRQTVEDQYVMHCDDNMLFIDSNTSPSLSCKQYNLWHAKVNFGAQVLQNQSFSSRSNICRSLAASSATVILRLRRIVEFDDNL
jgi:hypothetical protein